MAKVICKNEIYTLRSDWNVDDILDAANQMNKKITNDQAIRVMYHVTHTFDANFGINWDVIETSIRDILLEDKLKKS
jgi:hypothetical protein